MEEERYDIIDNWLNERVYFDNGVRRILMTDHEGKLYFEAHWSDFDKDDIEVKRHYIDDLPEGWYDDVVENFLF